MARHSKPCCLSPLAGRGKPTRAERFEPPLSSVPVLTFAANIKLNSRFNLPVCLTHLCLQMPEIFHRPSPCKGDQVISFSRHTRRSRCSHADAGQPDCRLVGYQVEAGLGQCLAPVDRLHPAPNDHGKAGVRQGLAAARRTTLDLQTLRPMERCGRLTTTSDR